MYFSAIPYLDCVSRHRIFARYVDSSLELGEMGRVMGFDMIVGEMNLSSLEGNLGNLDIRMGRVWDGARGFITGRFFLGRRWSGCSPR
jgi:hypothetical protein